MQLSLPETGRYATDTPWSRERAGLETLEGVAACVRMVVGNLHHCFHRDSREEMFGRDSDFYRETMAGAFNLVSHNHGRALYDGLVGAIQKHASTSPCKEDFVLGIALVNRICWQLDSSRYGSWVVAQKVTPLNVVARLAFEERVAVRSCAMHHWRRHALVVGKCSMVLEAVYNEVSYRPQHSGAKRAREEFEAIANDHA